jgi:sec-independent protein translocase protein TatA
MSSFGPGELLIILLVVLLLFGASRLPKLARSMGQASKEFKEGLREGATAESVEGDCPFCETHVSEGAKFCPGCGKSAEEIVAERAKSSST